MRRLDKRSLALILVAVLVTTPALYAQQTDDGEWLFKVKPKQKLRVDVETGGNITIVGWKRNEVKVIARPEWGSQDDVDVEVVRTSYGVKIRTSTPFRWRDMGWGRNNPDVHFTINIPDKFDVELESHGGDLFIKGVEGEFEGQIMGGDLDLEDLKGDVDLGTMGGDITIRESRLDGRVHTMGGDVELYNVSGGVRGSTMGGDVRYSGENNAKASDPIRISTMGGDINVEDAPSGGDMRTMGGDIHIRSASDFISARTMGGDIEIERLDGGVRATTMGGDIEIRMVGDVTKKDRSVEIISKGGDVTLIVPENLSMTVDITISFSRRGRRSNRRVSIESDFDLTIEESDEGRDRWGQSRRYIYGKGVFGSGKNKIHIETVNGRVILRKGK